MPKRPDTPRPPAAKVPKISSWSAAKLPRMADRFKKLTQYADTLFEDLEAANALRYSDPRNYRKAVEARKALAMLIHAGKQHKIHSMGKQ